LVRVRAWDCGWGLGKGGVRVIRVRFILQYEIRKKDQSEIRKKGPT
jgi:hypothetical protein